MSIITKFKPTLMEDNTTEQTGKEARAFNPSWEGIPPHQEPCWDIELTDGRIHKRVTFSMIRQATGNVLEYPENYMDIVRQKNIDAYSKCHIDNPTPPLPEGKDKYEMKAIKVLQSVKADVLADHKKCGIKNPTPYVRLIDDAINEVKEKQREVEKVSNQLNEVILMDEKLKEEVERLSTNMGDRLHGNISHRERELETENAKQSEEIESWKQKFKDLEPIIRLHVYRVLVGLYQCDGMSVPCKTRQEVEDKIVNGITEALKQKE